MTQPRPASELEGLVYGVTPIRHERAAKWHERPVPLAIIGVVVLILLNIWFF
jgi:SSS family solute:Na+ symporter